MHGMQSYGTVVELLISKDVQGHIKIDEEQT